MKINDRNARGARRSSTGSVVFAHILIALIFSVPAFSQGRKANSIVIHDSTTANDGGENSTADLRNEFKSALEKEKPCVETMDDQDIRDAIQDERDRALLEGGDSTATLQMLGERMNSGLVMSVRATPGPNGSVVYTAFVMNTQTAKAVARETATGDGAAKQIAENLVRALGPYLADTCQPHWVGTVSYVYSFSESKQKTDAGAMRAASRNTKRVLTESSTMTTTIKATLLAPPSGATGKAVNSPTARVMQRNRFVFAKNSSTSGELLCRPPGRNSFFKGFSEEYSETMTQLGQGTDNLPVFISIDDDGSYTIKVTAPAGVIYGKLETSRSASGCDSGDPAPTIDATDLPEGRFESTSFDANGKTDSSKPHVLAGQQTSPDGRTKINWSLRLVKPKGSK